MFCVKILMILLLVNSACFHKLLDLNSSFRRSENKRLCRLVSNRPTLAGRSITITSSQMMSLHNLILNFLPWLRCGRNSRKLMVRIQHFEAAISNDCLVLCVCGLRVLVMLNVFIICHYASPPTLSTFVVRS